MLREDFLFQNAFDEADAYTSLQKQYRLMKAIITFYKEALGVILAMVDMEMQDEESSNASEKERRRDALKHG